MKILLLANQKGGVGKSAVAVQLAHYLRSKRDKRVLFVDLDHQANSSKALRSAEGVTVSDVTSVDAMSSSDVSIEAADFVLLTADHALRKFEKVPASYNAMANNFIANLRGAASQFDVCIIDTNPSPDIRVTCALAAADYIVSPIQLNQEAIDGIGDLLKEIQRFTVAQPGKKALNDRLKFIGILPNMAMPTPFQRENFSEIATHFGKYLIKTGPKTFAVIKQSTAIAEAQAAGVPVWKLGKTSARDTWRDMEPSFTAIASAMEIQ